MKSMLMLIVILAVIGFVGFNAFNDNVLVPLQIVVSTIK